ALSAATGSIFTRTPIGFGPDVPLIQYVARGFSAAWSDADVSWDMRSSASPRASDESSCAKQRNETTPSLGRTECSLKSKSPMIRVCLRQLRNAATLPDIRL